MSGPAGTEPSGPVDADRALSVIRSAGRVWERDPTPYFGMDEPNLRTCLVGALSGAFAGRAVAEAFNARGKTDILVRSDDRNILIGECKVYNGKAGVLSAIDQILGYTSWRDLRICLIVFVRSGGITRAVEAVRAGAEESANVTRVEEVDGHEGELRLTATLPYDPERSVRLDTIVIHLPIPAGRRPRKPGEVIRPEDALEALLDIKRALPEDEGVEYTPVPDVRSHVPGPDAAWKVSLIRETPEGDSVAVQAVPTTRRGTHEHGPQGAIVAPDDETARALRDSLRRTQRDFVPTVFTGVGIRVDQIAAAFRDSADALERAGPRDLTLSYSPRGLWQCNLRLETDRGQLEVPVAFVALDSPVGWDATVRATIFDFSLTMSMHLEDRETRFEWKLSGSTEPQPAAERPAALEFLYVYSGRGAMTIVGVEPKYGNGDFGLDGFELDTETLLERELFVNLAAIERHVGTSIPVPDLLDQDWVDEVFAAGEALRTGRATMFLDQVIARIGPDEGVPEVGAVSRYSLPLEASYDIAGQRVTLPGVADFVGLVKDLTPDGEKAAVTLVPATPDDRRVVVRAAGDEGSAS